MERITAAYRRVKVLDEAIAKLPEDLEDIFFEPDQRVELAIQIAQVQATTTLAQSVIELQGELEGIRQAIIGR